MALKDDAHELMMCIGLQAILGNTGTPAVGASKFSTLGPQIYMGKGFGELPEVLSWLRNTA